MTLKRIPWSTKILAAIAAPARKRRDALLLCGLFLVSLLIVFPVGNFPLNDDWTYTKSLLKLVNQGVLDMGTSASSLVTQLFWGMIFTKMFGFSFMILRISTWVSALITILVLFPIVREITGRRSVAGLFVCCLVFNPLYFSLANTYMTDVNFCTLLCCCLHQAWHFWRGERLIHFAGFFLFSLLLVFLRQFGMIVPVAFAVSCLFVTNNRLRWFFLSVAGTAFVYLLLWLFETSLVAEASSYHASQKHGVFDAALWQMLEVKLELRYRSLVANACIWAAPFLALYLLPLARRLHKAVAGVVLLAAIIFSWLIFNPANFPLQNVFANMILGADTFFESLTVPRAPLPHTYSFVFARVLDVVQALGLFISCSVLGLWIASFFSVREYRRPLPLPVFCLVFTVGYAFMLLVPEMYHDRYFLPLVFVIMLLVASAKAQHFNFWPLLLLALPMFYVSLAGTRDYFVLNRLRWEAYEHLRDDKKVPVERINGGYEVNCWHEGRDFNWWDHVLLQNHNYLIQYSIEPGFSVYREYEFQRYFPFKKDKIYIFERNHKITDQQ